MLNSGMIQKTKQTNKQRKFKKNYTALQKCNHQ